MLKNAAAVLLTVLQLNQLKHAQQDMGLKPPSPPPKTKPKQLRPYAPLNPVPTKAPSAPAAPKTPAAETGKVEAAKSPNDPTGNAVGSPVTDEQTGSVLMPSPQ
jgi:hypothetical protein